VDAASVDFAPSEDIEGHPRDGARHRGLRAVIINVGWLPQGVR
jgi:hypothetical protein